MDGTRRFSDRVEAYVKYRPSYPRAILEVLADRWGFSAASIVADVGSGTGKLTELFLEHGNPVFAVEPNREMRAAAERMLSGNPGFRSVDGRAEATTLPGASVDLVAAGQSFHWFDAAASREEFRRILRPEGSVLLVWNDRDLDAPGFASEYEGFLREHSVDYLEVNRRGKTTAETVAAFFRTQEAFTLPNHRTLDFDAVRGQYLSASYACAEAHPRHAEAMEALRALFDRNASGGMISLPMVTTCHLGRL
jgi:SAM-dependent methyltransferase